MKLSEAIGLGSLLRPQKFDGNFSTKTNTQATSWDDVTETCAFVAAAHALDLPWHILTEDSYGLRGAAPAGSYAVTLPASWIIPASCPVCQDAVVFTTAYIIPHLNDYHRWTREQIAEWVETIEPQEAPVLEPELAGQAT